MAKRVSLSPRTRFEVFKRDDFTCRYCGRKTPEVVLQVDHVVPVAEGGDEDYANLVTSCFECNSGKGARLLDSVVPLIDLEEQSLLLLERERQLREYNEVRRSVREREDADIDYLIAYWRDWFDNAQVPVPKDSSFRCWLAFMSVEDMRDMIEATILRTKNAGHALRYFCATMRNIRNERLSRGEVTDGAHQDDQA